MTLNPHKSKSKPLGINVLTFILIFSHVNGVNGRNNWGIERGKQIKRGLDKLCKEWQTHQSWSQKLEWKLLHPSIHPTSLLGAEGRWFCVSSRFCPKCFNRLWNVAFPLLSMEDYPARNSFLGKTPSTSRWFRVYLCNCTICSIKHMSGARKADIVFTVWDEHSVGPRVKQLIPKYQKPNVNVLQVAWED